MDTNFLSADFWEKAGVKDVQDELDKGAEVNARGDWGEETPLHWAAKYSNDPAAVGLLLEYVDDINAGDEYGETPLHWAAVRSQTPAVVTWRSDKDANTEARQPTPYFDINSVRNLKNIALGIVTLLLDNGAKIEACNANGQTPLHKAVGHSKTTEDAALAVLELLLSYKKDDETDEQADQRLKVLAKVKDISGKTAFDDAKKNKDLQGTKVYQRLEYLTSD